MGSSPLIKMWHGQGSEDAPECMDCMVVAVSSVVMVSQAVRVILWVLFFFLQFYIAQIRPKGIGALYMNTSYIAQGHIYFLRVTGC